MEHLIGSLLLIIGMHTWRPKMYSFVSVLIRLISLTLKKHLFCILSMQTMLVRPPFMHSVNDRESERTKISLHSVVTFRCKFLVSHFHIFMTLWSQQTPD